MLGLHNTVTAWIRSQPGRSKPTGTVTSATSALGGLRFPAQSAYSIAKLAGYPILRAFTINPGIVRTEIPNPIFDPFAGDSVDLVGAWTMYLTSPRAAFLNGSLVSVNSDVEEMEAKRDAIEEGALQMSRLPILPISQGLYLGDVKVA